ncbi:hypothetical protein ACFX12_022749 [Malus domestica]
MNRAASNAVDPGSSHLNPVAAELRRVDSVANSLLVLIVTAASLQHLERRLLALLDLPKRDLEAVPDRDLALLELVERRLGLVLTRSIGVAFYARADQEHLVPCCSFSSCRQGALGCCLLGSCRPGALVLPFMLVQTRSIWCRVAVSARAAKERWVVTF